MAAILFSAAVAVMAGAASADTSPPSGTPATVSADALPTVQQNGVVWAQVTVGNIVYATGSFAYTWPAGAANVPANRTPRGNLLAYDITTGQLTSFSHTLNAQGLALAVTPDHTELVVGGDFTTVDGQARNRVAAFNLTTGALDPSFKPSMNGSVRALAASNSTVWMGGSFSTADGVARTRLAAYALTGAARSWAPKADDNIVTAIVLTPDQTTVVVGGRFSTLNGVAAYGLGAVGSVAGTTQPYAVNHVIRDYTSKAGIESLTTDGQLVYGTGFAYGAGNFEGTFAVDPNSGQIRWLEDCHGDTYSAAVIGQVIYTVGHAHDCRWIGAFPETSPRTWHRALAFTTYATGVNTGPDNYGWNFAGQPAPSLLQWYPTLTSGTVTGQNQAAWSVTGNTNYVALAGEFPTVNGVAQQGLVRFAIAADAPNKVGPGSYSGAGYGVMALPATASGNSTVRVFNTGDSDNGRLTYNLYRKGSSTLLATHTLDSRFWKADSWTFTDTGLPPGTSAQYLLVVTDPFGNSRTYGDPTLVDDTDSRVSYSGTWTSSQTRPDTEPDFNRGIHYTSVNGNSYSFSFYGSAIQLIGERGTSRGTMSISIDGGTPVQATANDAHTLFQQTIYSTSGLGFGKHTIKITKTGGVYMDVDAFHVTQDNSYDDNGSAVTYANPANWTSRQNSAANPDFGKGIHYTQVNGESATFTFSGTSVALMSEKNYGRGDISVSVDGGAPVTASEYKATGTLYQQIVFSMTGLSAGTHTLKVTKVSGAYMDIDAVFSR